VRIKAIPSKNLRVLATNFFQIGRVRLCNDGGKSMIRGWPAGKVRPTGQVGARPVPQPFSPFDEDPPNANGSTTPAACAFKESAS